MRWLNNMEVSNLIMASHLSTNMYPIIFIIIVCIQKNLIYQQPDGEDILASYLEHLFPDLETARGFLTMCTSYMIVQNYGQGIGA